MTNFPALLARAKEKDSYHVEAIKLDFILGINHLMKVKGIKGKELAEKIGCTPAYVSKVLSGSHTPTLETMVKMARSLGAEISLKIEELT